jgi:hypothetical protein
MRINNWPSALVDHIDANRKTPFAWGSHDCMLWGASCVEAITGIDPAAEIRGTYSSALAAYRIIESNGGFDETVGAFIPSGAETQTHRNLAMRGDLVTTTDDRGRKALGVCDGLWGVFPGPSGLTFIKRADLDLLAWKVL